MLTRMQICWLWLLISFGNHALAATDCAVQTDIPQSQCQALVDLYNSTGGDDPYWWFGYDWIGDDYYSGDHWNTTNTPCHWKGITCSEGVVTEIFVYFRYLKGTLPNSIVNLTGLASLTLSDDYLTGTIPALPPSLTSLNLSGNQLTGTVPTLPPNLTSLNLSGNQLTGTIPTLLPSLTSLNLSGNQLTGIIPTLPTGLTSLYLSGNQLTGTIPNLPLGLKYIDLRNNQLTGTYIGRTNCAIQTDIPQSQCQALVDLYNATDGTNWWNTPNSWNITNTPCSWAGVICSNGVVTELKLPENRLSGTIPDNFLKELPELQVLMLNDNGLSGTISVLPTQLTSLDLGGNYLTGTIPTLPEGLVRLGLERNQLTGAIPKLPAALTYLNLFGNQLTGTIPELPTGLTTLWLAMNQLTGMLPNLPAGLESLNLNYNQFTGTIPNLPTHLTYLDLRNNQLSGSIPNLPESLISLDLSHNQFTGTIPKLPSILSNLNLSYNQLSGTIPALPIVPREVGGGVDLSNNPLTGTVPTLPPGLSYINLSNTFVSVASSSSAPAAPSNNGIASEIMSNYGQVANNLTVTETGSVSGGTLTGTITNKGLIANATIAPQAILSGGKLSGFNVNQGTITDVTLSQYAQISGGNYAGIIHNYGSLLNPTILEKTDISGGQLAGVVFNQGTVHDVNFAPQTQVIGGKLTGTLIGSAESVVIIGEAELDAAKIGNACLTVTTQVSQTVELKNTVWHTATDFTQLIPEDFCIQPQSIAHFTAQRLAATEKLAFSSFTAQQIAELPTVALSVLSAAQLAQFSPETLQGLSVEQFQAIPIASLVGLHENNMAGLTPQVIRSIDQQRLQTLTATEFQQMPGFGVAKWLTHLNNQLTMADIIPLLPTGWKLNETGQISAPADTTIALKALEVQSIPQLELPSYQFDLNTTFSIGGQITTQTVFDSIKTLLSSTASQLTQTEYGILMGKLTATRSFAFMVNPQELWQRTQQDSKIQLTENQPYQLTTSEQLEIHLSPVPKDPLEMLKILGQAQAVIGTQGDVFLSWEQESLPHYLVALFSPFSETTATKPPGLYFGDKQAQLIYQDGTAQVLYPTVFSPETFIEEAKKFPGVESVTFNMDGTFEVGYQGQKLQLFPNFDVKVTELEKYQHVKPSVTLKGNALEYQVQHGQQLLTTEVSFEQ